MLQVLVSGLSLSAYYALLALGFAMIYSTLRIFNIAHAAVFGAAAYVFYFLYRVENINLFVSLLITVICAALLGLLIDLSIYRPLTARGGGTFNIFIASLGVATLFEAVALLATHGTPLVAHAGSLTSISIGTVSFRLLDVVVVASVAVLYGVLFYAIMTTRTGLEIRALADNHTMAGVVGIDTNRARTSIFLIASALAGLAGILTVYDSGVVPTTGLNLLFVTFVAVIFGGTRRLFMGALGGSVVMGLVTAFAGFFFPQWVMVIVFLLLIALLIARPQGFFG
jgi:branched-subunit amino acid ABC-type transport system permease component